MIETLGLRNIRIEMMDLTRVPADIGAFDYVIAHGVYAWVPEPVRAALMNLVGRVLSPQGVAFISYNAMPGGHIRRALRDMLLLKAGGLADPRERVRQARIALEAYMQRWSADRPMQAALREQATALLKKDDGVIFHDEMGEVFEPQSISDVVAAAQAEGLDYLCDAQLPLALEAIAPGEDSAADKTGPAFAQYEQFRDFAEVRGFRQSVFCRAAGPITRGVTAQRVNGLWVNCRLTYGLAKSQGEAMHAFQSQKGITAQTNLATLADLLQRASRAFPAAVRIETVDDDMAQQLWQLAANDIVELTTGPMPFVSTIPGRPKISALARHLLAQGQTEVPTLRHKVVTFTDMTTTRFIALMDGSRTVAEIAKVMMTHTGASLPHAKDDAHRGIKAMMELGLLVE
jgi:SAM-dependent methyltransferase